MQWESFPNYRGRALDGTRAASGGGGEGGGNLGRRSHFGVIAVSCSSCLLHEDDSYCHAMIVGFKLLCIYVYRLYAMI